jgi:hypothetical protein
MRRRSAISSKTTMKKGISRGKKLPREFFEWRNKMIIISQCVVRIASGHNQAVVVFENLHTSGIRVLRCEHDVRVLSCESLVHGIDFLTSPTFSRIFRAITWSQKTRANIWLFTEHKLMLRLSDPRRLSVSSTSHTPQGLFRATIEGIQRRGANGAKERKG